MKELRISLFLYLITSVSVVNANPEIIQAAEKFILLSNQLELKIMPPGSQSHEIFRSISFSTGLNIMIDDVRVLLSELQHRTTRKDLSVKSLFVMNLPKLVFPVFPTTFYESTADFSLQQLRAVTLDQFCSQNLGESDSKLYEKLKSSLSRVREIVIGIELLKSLCESLSLNTLLFEVIEALNRIK